MTIRIRGRPLLPMILSVLLLLGLALGRADDGDALKALYVKHLDDIAILQKTSDWAPQQCEQMMFHRRIVEITCKMLRVAGSPGYPGRDPASDMGWLYLLRPAVCRDSPLQDGHRGDFTAILRCCNWDFGTLLHTSSSSGRRICSRNIKLFDLTVRQGAGNRRRSGRHAEAFEYLMNCLGRLCGLRVYVASNSGAPLYQGLAKIVDHIISDPIEHEAGLSILDLQATTIPSFDHQ